MVVEVVDVGGMDVVVVDGLVVVVVLVVVELVVVEGDVEVVEELGATVVDELVDEELELEVLDGPLVRIDQRHDETRRPPTTIAAALTVRTRNLRDLMVLDSY